MTTSNNTNTRKIRTVTINSRGQLVIPEDIRKDFDISGETTLVLLERNGEIVLKKGSDVLNILEGEDRFWHAVSHEAMKRAWGKEDEVWDKLYEETSK